MSNQKISLWEPLSPNIISLAELLALYEEDDTFSQLPRLDNLVLKAPINIAFAKLCYGKWRMDGVSDNTRLLVLPDSYMPERYPIMVAVLRGLGASIQSGKKDRTVNSVYDLLLPFLEYCFSHGIPADVATARKHYIHYSDLLGHEMKIYDKAAGLGLSSRYAASRQSVALSFLASLVDESKEAINSGIKKIKRNDKQRQITQPLSDEQLGKMFTFYTNLFRQLTDIILNPESLPYHLQLPSENLWIAPTPNVYVKPAHRKHEMGLRSFNYENGTFYTADELVLRFNIKKRRATQHVWQGKAAQVMANQPLSSVRLRLAIWACKAYFMHFLVLTGSNDSTAARLLFDGKYTNHQSDQAHFRSIKWRANGRKVEFEIQSEFIGDFKRYLALRDYLLANYQTKDNQDYHYLFIGGGQCGLRPLHQIGAASSAIRQDTARVFTGELGRGTSREIRVTKGLWVRKSFGGPIAAYVLQHSEPVANKNYTGKDDETTADEFSDFFAVVDKAMNTEPDEGIAETATGRCGNIGNPSPLGSAPVEVDCSQGEGCLFCIHYRPHADEVDIRKLLSLRYLIDLCQDNAANQAHHERVFRDTLSRIDYWLQALVDKVPTLALALEQITKEVYEKELLSDYWLVRLELLQDLGVL
jgi:hypothetical protein